MEIKEQRLLIQYLLSSEDIFSTCISIISPDHFHPKLKPVVSFIKTYYENYHGIVDCAVLNAKFTVDGGDFSTRDIAHSDYKYACDSIETFCRQEEVRNAIITHSANLNKGNIAPLYEAITKAMTLSLEKDLGVDFYDDPLAMFLKMQENTVSYTTGIREIDQRIGGGGYRKQLTLFSANSGGGKSVMLTNMAVNYSLQGMNVLYLSLELPEDQIYLRAASILTDLSIEKWRDQIDSFVSGIIQTKTNGAGSLKIKRIKGNCNCLDIRSYLKQYEIKHKFLPDVLVVDYLDKMTPNSGKGNKSVSEQDKEKTEELAELLLDYNMIGFSASQQTREAIGEAAPTQAVIAGGITKVNTVDNYISLFMTDIMKKKGEMIAFFLKTRYSGGVGEQILLKYSPSSLRITDMIGAMDFKTLAKERKKQIEYLVKNGFITEEDDEIIESNPMISAIFDRGDEKNHITTKITEQQNISNKKQEDEISSFAMQMLAEDKELEGYVTI